MRRWSFSGWHKNVFLRAEYHRTRDDGNFVEGSSATHVSGSGEGFMKLNVERDSDYRGHFVEEVVESTEFGVQFVEFSSGLRWIRFGSAKEAAVIKLLIKQPGQ